MNQQNKKMALKESQIILQNHSAVKVELLKKYIERYLIVIGHSQFFDEIYIYDLFCGEGIYPNGGHGSPIILLNSVKTVKESSSNQNLKNTKIYCHFNDVIQEKVEQVEGFYNNNQSNYQEIEDVTFSVDEYENWIPLLKEKFNSFNNNQKGFVFIDPYQYKGISIRDIKDLMKSNNCEVLLWLPTQFMFRFELKGTPEALKDFIAEMVPPEEWPQSETGLNFIDNLREHFKQVMCENNSNYFVDSFVIEKAKNEFFCLFFFTSHIYGFEKMLEAKWEIDGNNGRGWNPSDYSKGGIQTNMFDEIKPEASTNVFERKLKSFLSEPRNNVELYEFTLRSGHLKKHCNEILKQFELNKQIQVENVGINTRKKGAYYINFDHYKVNGIKILIQYNLN